MLFRKTGSGRAPWRKGDWIFPSWANGHVLRGAALRYYKWQEVYRPEMDMCHSEIVLGSQVQPQRWWMGFRRRSGQSLLPLRISHWGTPNLVQRHWMSGERGYKLFSVLFHLANFLCIFSALKLIILVYILIKNAFFELKIILFFFGAFCTEEGQDTLPQSSWLEVPSYSSIQICLVITFSLCAASWLLHSPSLTLCLGTRCCEPGWAEAEGTAAAER